MNTRQNTKEYIKGKYFFIHCIEQKVKFIVYLAFADLSILILIQRFNNNVSFNGRL